MAQVCRSHRRPARRLRRSHDPTVPTGATPMRLFPRLCQRQQSRRFRHLRLDILEHRTAPAVLTVNSTADTASPGDPYLSLREAVAIVNSPALPSGLSPQILAQISGTLHGNASDTIQFAVNGPITL